MANSAQKKLVDTPPAEAAYTAKDIEVLEGLEPVRRRPGMYIGGTDERAYHHLFAEILDNAMDEAVAGHADRIDVELSAEGWLTVSDNGRGIPVDPHPKYKDKSALEVIMTVLHSGGKFSDKAYQTSGGLHGVGVSVVNALSERLEVEVARSKQLYFQAFSRGKPITRLENRGPVHNRRGTVVRFKPDAQIFGADAGFKPHRLFQMARSKAYLSRGVWIRWKCAPELLRDGADTPAEAVLHFPNGLGDFLKDLIADKKTVTSEPFIGKVERQGAAGGVEWAITWGESGFGDADGFMRSYCNTVPTPEGGAHEQGLRAALTKGLRAYGDLKNEKKTGLITAEDVMGTVGGLISVFIKEPEFQGQTKDRLSSPDAAKLVETIVRDHFDHWLAAAPREADRLLDWAVYQAEERLKRRKDKEIQRQSATRRLRLPGKLTDCANSGPEGTELFLVEGDSAGGTAKQARNRATQALLPLRGKILNVASAAGDKASTNQELNDLALALGSSPGPRFRLADLRYERIIIMTDADIDGAHIASLLITYFYRSMPDLVGAGRLFLAMPPLYRISHGGKVAYARDNAHRDELLATVFKGKKPDIGRFKGLGEMMPNQLKETTMDPAKRTLARVILPEGGETSAAELVEALMGKRPEARLKFIQENADVIDALDV
jgi:topoisomerase-4 subunit B